MRDEDAHLLLVRCKDTDCVILQATDSFFDSTGQRKKVRLMEESNKKRKRYGGEAQGNQPPFDGSQDDPMPLPNPMVGFNLPSDRLRSVKRRLTKQVIGPPFFYYENVALAPRGVWRTISRTLYDVEPEFVDSKYLCAAARKRGYIHNLPIDNRSPLLPLPPKNIFEAFPDYEKWWPSWDPRRQLNCLLTSVASAKLTERIDPSYHSPGRVHTGPRASAPESSDRGSDGTQLLFVIQVLQINVLKKISNSLTGNSCSVCL